MPCEKLFFYELFDLGGIDLGEVVEKFVVESLVRDAFLEETKTEEDHFSHLFLLGEEFGLIEKDRVGEGFSGIGFLEVLGEAARVEIAHFACEAMGADTKAVIGLVTPSEQIVKTLVIGFGPVGDFVMRIAIILEGLFGVFIHVCGEVVVGEGELALMDLMMEGGVLFDGEGV